MTHIDAIPTEYLPHDNGREASCGEKDLTSPVVCESMLKIANVENHCTNWEEDHK